ncbi:MAG: ABC transporter ATP-binding protein [Planctomycetota bacterium]
MSENETHTDEPDDDAPDSPAGEGVKWQAAWPLLKRLWPFMRAEKKRALVIAGIVLIAVPTSVVAPFLVQKLIDEVLPRRDLSEILWVSGQMVGLSLISGLLGYAQAVIAIRIFTRVRFRLTREIFDHLLRLPLSYLQGHSTGYLMSRVRDDVAALESVMVDRFIDVAAAVLRTLTFLGLLFLFDVGLALSGAVLVLLILGLVALASPALRRRSEKSRETDAESSAALHEALSGLNTVRTSAQELQERRRYRKTVKRSLRAQAQRDVLGVLTGTAFGSLGTVGIYVIVAVGAYRISAGVSTFGSLFAFFVALTQVMMATGSLTAMIPGIQTSLASLARLFALLGEATEKDEASKDSAPEFVDALIEFEGVSFRYDETSALVLDSIDVASKPGEMTALVGRSGAGKSTLVHLLSRLYDPTSGRILLAGRPLEEYPLRWLRRQIGVVSQDVFLFDRSIRENIAYARPESSDEEILKAAEAAHAKAFIDGLPEGLDTVVGERGVRVSGGEKQRLSIARELLRDPPILILDEATSNLDAESESLVREALQRLLEGRTCFVIAHRLSTVLEADQIVVLDGGRIESRGRHEELLAAGGLYRELYEMQFRSEPGTGP